MPRTGATNAGRSAPQARRDGFTGLATLPPDLVQDLDGLIVDRHGNDPDAFMVTEDIIGHVVPGERYRLTLAGLEKTDQPPTAPVPCEVTVPPHVVIDGTWTRLDSSDAIDANILGGFGSFTLGTPDTALAIPEARPSRDMLAYYGAHLVTVGDVLAIDASGNLPVTVTAVGETYIDDYVMVEGRGDGFYIEMHDRPHLHMPLDAAAHGHLVFGRKLDDRRYALSAFRIPFGHAVLMSPYIIHTDACLVGRYLVIYSITEDFSTVILRASNGTIAKPIVTPLLGRTA